MSKGLASLCAGLALLMTGVIVATDKQPQVAPSLECSVDDALTFKAFNARHWDMRDGTLFVVSRERDTDGVTREYALERAYLPGETCREVAPPSAERAP